MDLSNFIFDNIQGLATFYGYVNGVTIKNSVFKATAFSGADGAIKLIGNNNIIESNIIDAQNLPINTKFIPSGNRSSTGNIIRYNTFMNAREESIGWDGLFGGSLSAFVLFGSVSFKTSSSITITELEVDPFKNNYKLFNTNHLVDAYALIATGHARGNYYKITAQSNRTLTLNTETFDLADVNEGDLVVVSYAFVDNEIHNNTIHVDADDYSDVGFGQHVGVSLWGSCYGNNVHHNIIRDDKHTPSITDQSCGINDTGLSWNFGRGQYGYAPNSKNTYTSNTMVNLYEDWRLTNFVYDDTIIGFWQGEYLNRLVSLEYVIPSIGITFTGNVGGGGFATLNNYIDFTYSENTASQIVSYEYDARYVSPLTDQSPLGGYWFTDTENNRTAGFYQQGLPITLSSANDVSQAMKSTLSNTVGGQ